MDPHHPRGAPAHAGAASGTDAGRRTDGAHGGRASGPGRGTRRVGHSSLCRLWRAHGDTHPAALQP
eukprot:7013887-Lingulodinium_polyedra.AAC.1